jgi:hypothetical protein
MELFEKMIRLGLVAWFFFDKNSIHEERWETELGKDADSKRLERERKRNGRHLIVRAVNRNGTRQGRNS